MSEEEIGKDVDVSAELVNEAHRRSVTAVLEAFYAEREHVEDGDEEKSHPFAGDDVIYGNAHVTVGDWLVEAMGSGASALEYRESAFIAERPGTLEERVPEAHHTAIAALSVIGALEALATQTGEPKLADRQWVVRSAARDAVHSWQEMREERKRLEHAVTFCLANALLVYVRAFEKGVEVDPMVVAKFLIQALAWTAGELVLGEQEAE